MRERERERERERVKSKALFFRMFFLFYAGNWSFSVEFTSYIWPLLASFFSYPGRCSFEMKKRVLLIIIFFLSFLISLSLSLLLALVAVGLDAISDLSWC